MASILQLIEEGHRRRRAHCQWLTEHGLRPAFAAELAYGGSGTSAEPECETEAA
jgi:hypothetical protein